jgi:hypothetical protein
MDHLPLAQRAWVHLTDTVNPTTPSAQIVHSGTLGAMIRWMRDQPESERSRYLVGIQHQSSLITYREIEIFAVRTGVLGNDFFQSGHA